MNFSRPLSFSIGNTPASLVSLLILLRIRQAHVLHPDLAHCHSSIRSSRAPQLANRIAPGSDPLAIRGASKHLTTGQRMRRNAMSGTTADGGPRTSSRVAALGVKTLDVWRDFVNRRWNPEARFLNLEVSEFNTFLSRDIDLNIPSSEWPTTNN